MFCVSYIPAIKLAQAYVATKQELKDRPYLINLLAPLVLLTHADQAGPVAEDGTCGPTSVELKEGWEGWESPSNLEEDEPGGGCKRRRRHTTSDSQGPWLHHEHIVGGVDVLCTRNYKAAWEYIPNKSLCKVARALVDGKGEDTLGAKWTSSGSYQMATYMTRHWKNNMSVLGYDRPILGCGCSVSQISFVVMKPEGLVEVDASGKVTSGANEDEVASALMGVAASLRALNGKVPDSSKKKLAIDFNAKLDAFEQGFYVKGKFYVTKVAPFIPLDELHKGLDEEGYTHLQALVLAVCGKQAKDWTADEVKRRVNYWRAEVEKCQQSVPPAPSAQSRLKP